MTDYDTYLLNHLPDLVGSPKQVAWARSIRLAAIAATRLRPPAMAEADWNQARYLLATRIHAAWWIALKDTDWAVELLDWVKPGTPPLPASEPDWAVQIGKEVLQ